MILANAPHHTDSALEAQIEAILKKMNLLEKTALLSGRDNWRTTAIPRLGIPALVVTDGPHGVRAGNLSGFEAQGRKIEPATCFPTGAAMAASWNPELIERVGMALGAETRALGCDVILGPCVNIVRTPLGGRNFEMLSEDPFLAARLTVAYIKGVQSQQVGTSLKHYAVNNHEVERNRVNINLDERTLREIYLPAFEAGVKEAEPWTVMCSYNRINGTYASQHYHLLTEILKQEWGFKGVVVSDWGANHTIFESLQNGLDLEMPGPGMYFEKHLAPAVMNWQIEESALDKAVRRMLRLILLSGRMDAPEVIPSGALNTPEHAALARELAQESITLLKNETAILPLKVESLKTVAVIGRNAQYPAMGGGGSSLVEPPYRVSPLAALRSQLGDRVRFEQGADNFQEVPLPDPAWLSLPKGGVQEGISLWQTEYFNNSDLSGEPVITVPCVQPAMWIFNNAPPVENVDGRAFSGRWSVILTVPTSGTYTLELACFGKMRAYLDDQRVSQTPDFDPDKLNLDFTPTLEQIDLVGGKPYLLQLEFIKNPFVPIAFFRVGLAAQPRWGHDDRIEKAVALAKNAEVALVFAGHAEGFESEGRDRLSLELPAFQNELIHAVAAVNPNTVVILNVGAPVSMPWIHEVSAILDMHYAGQEGGNAIADILLGKVNPSGKLAVTFPKRLEDTPAFLNSGYPDGRDVTYGEGIFVGYRYYDKRDIEPLFPFGHGLSYTSFAYGTVTAPQNAKRGESVEVSVTITNTGSYAGKEVVQLYVHDRESSVPKAPKELKGFAKVSLNPGESAVCSFTLNARSFAYYDAVQKDWVIEPGTYEILVGSSSRDIRSRTQITLID